MYLHDAIEQVLRDRGGPMHRRDIADEINRRNLYERRDGAPVPPNQISARIARPEHRERFATSEGVVSLTRSAAET